MLRDRRGDALRVWWDARQARRQGPEALRQRQRQRDRLAEQVAHAREHSPYYRQLYGGLPERVEDVTLLPVTDKRRLMARFDEVVTDPAVTLQELQRFVADPSRIGERFAGRYLVATTAGTTGTQGVFVLDDRYWAVTSGLMGVLGSAWFSWRDTLRIVARGGRFAAVIATGGHYLGVATSTREQRERPVRRRGLEMFSVHTPLPRLVERLNAFGPAVLGGYASVLRLLATEQQAGRLRLRPAAVLSTAETLPGAERARLEEAFGAIVREVYGCTEVGYAAYSCAEGWLHLLEDWVIVEPVDAEYRPVPPGTASHTVLITNLANRVQPILRYDLGDSVLVKPGPCGCGDRAPALRVQGRASNALVFPTADRAGEVTVPPLALESAVGHAPGVELFQVVQVSPTRLSVRLRPEPGADPERVWAAVQDGLTALLSGLGLAHVAVEWAPAVPRQGAGGKFRTVIPLATAATSGPAPPSGAAPDPAPSSDQ